MLYPNGVELPGQQRLKDLVDASSQAEVAKRINCKQQAISRWLRGSTIPNAFYQQALEKAFGIRRDEWLSPAQKLALHALQREASRSKKSRPRTSREATSRSELSTGGGDALPPRTKNDA